MSETPTTPTPNRHGAASPHPAPPDQTRPAGAWGAVLDEQALTQIRSARTKFLAMAATYTLGVFNAHYFKQAGLLLAVSLGLKDFQGYGTMAFTLPFLALAAPAGWLADRYAKRSVIIASKYLELAAMLAGALGIWLVSWPLIFLMLFTIGAQESIFSPALNGSIPELYPEAFVTTANGRVRMAVTMAILLGIAFAGLCLEKRPDGTMAGREIVAVCVILLALLGLASSYGLKRVPPSGTAAPFPWAGPLDTLGLLWALRRDLLLTLSIWGNAGFWFLASIQVLLINSMAVNEFGSTESAASGLLVAQMLGVGIGSLLAGQLGSGPRWYRLLIPAARGMGLTLLLVAGLPLLVGNPAMREPQQLVLLGVLLALVGLAGGLFMIPQESFIQTRPAPDQKGRVIAAANFAAFSGIFLSGPVFNLLTDSYRPSLCYCVLSGIAFAIVMAFRLLLPRAVVAWQESLNPSEQHGLGAPPLNPAPPDPLLAP